ncbi:MAG TPA: ABC transporter permease subunit [Clostridia bacterium]|nr:ABC transporter permease subunit [Clostridia bacterium]
MIRTSVSLLLVIAVFILVASGPSLIRMESNEIHLHPEALFQSLAEMGDRAVNGTLMKYQAGRAYHKLNETLPVYFMISLRYILFSALLSLLIGVSLAFLTSFRQGRLITSVIEFLHIIPDFVLAFFLQIMVIAITQATGYRIARIAHMSEASPAYTLPIAVMTIVATVLIIRGVHGYLEEVKSQDYMRFAIAKGLSKPRLISTHLLVPILYKLRGDLHGLLSLLIGNLFIIERIFNIPGVTNFLFHNAFQKISTSLIDGNIQFVTQLHVALSGLLSIVVIYWLLYGLISLILTLVIRWRE